MTYYKVLDEDGSCYHGGAGKWHLPESGKPGRWMPTIEGKLVPCERGYHVLEEGDLIYWLGPALYEVEIGKQYVRDGNKGVTQRARLLRRVDAWNERTARLFAADCAEHVLHLYEGKYPGDNRPHEAIAAAREFAEGRISRAELSAAWSAARAAARAAEAAAWAAAWSVAKAAAWAAARAAEAAGAAAWSAAEAAEVARAAEAAGAAEAERKWQTERLCAAIAAEREGMR